MKSTVSISNMAGLCLKMHLRQMRHYFRWRHKCKKLLRPVRYTSDLFQFQDALIILWTKKSALLKTW